MISNMAHLIGSEWIGLPLQPITLPIFVQPIVLTLTILTRRVHHTVAPRSGVPSLQ